MTVKAWPRSSLEVIETELFFQLLMGLLAKPSIQLSKGNRAGDADLRPGSAYRCKLQPVNSKWAS